VLVNKLLVHFYVISGFQVPGLPGNLRIVKVIGKCVTVAWTPPVFDGGAEITGYDIAYFTADDSVAQHVTVRATTTAKLNKKLRRGQSYVFAVAAKNALGFGDFSHFSERITVPKTIGDYVFLKIVALC